MSISVQRSASIVPDERRAEILAAPGFGRYFTDHMVRADWVDGAWLDAELIPYGPLSVDPAMNSLHYGQLIFEGLKAYRQPDGTIAAFRPDANAARFARSATRMQMPTLPADVFVESIETLVDVDRAWVPDDAASSLYLRPFMISTEVGLGVRPANRYAYLLIASPAGSYFAGGLNPVTVWVSTEYARAAVGGTGDAKCAGNYAGSLAAQAQAAAEGCDQVVWIDAAERRWIEEMGTNNLYFVYGSGDAARLVTPELSGTLLPGITRDSLLTLGSDLGYSVEEGKISVDEWRDGCASGAITETFACGTAAVVTPGGTVKSAAESWTVGDGTYPVAERLRDALVGIQTGQRADEHGWMHTVAR